MEMITYPVVLKLLKTLVAAILVLALLAKFIPGISYQNDLRVLLQAALVFALIQVLVYPVVNLLALPLNLLTLGFASLVINIGLFWSISYIVPAFTFHSFYFPGYTSGAFVVPAVTIPEVATIAIGAFSASFLMALVRKVLGD